MNGQDLGDRFGGRPLTQTEYDAAVRIEKKRIRWFWILMLPVVAMLAFGMARYVQTAGERRLEIAVINETGLDHRYAEANYNNYCMIEYHNQRHGTAYEYFNRLDRQSIPRELEIDMREAYYVGYLYASEEERVDFAPALSFDEFDKKLQAMADKAREKLRPPYEMWKRFSRGAGAVAMAFVVAMILLSTDRRRLDGMQVVCREGLASTSMYSLMNMMKFTLFVTVEAMEQKGSDEYTQCLKVKRWHMPPREARLFLRMDEVPVLLVLVDGKLRYYPTLLMKTEAKK